MIILTVLLYRKNDYYLAENCYDFVDARTDI